MFPFVPDVPGVPPLLRNLTNSAIQIPALLNADGAIDKVDKPTGPQWGIFDDAGHPVIVPDSVVAIEFIAEQRVADFPIEKGSFGSYNKVARPYEGRVTMNKGGTEAERTAFLNALESELKSLDLRTLTTPEKSYDNANVTHYTYRRTSENGVQLITAEVWVQEVRVASSPSFTNTQQPSGQDAQNDGAIQAQTPTAAQAASASAQLTVDKPVAGAGGTP